MTEENSPGNGTSEVEPQAPHLDAKAQIELLQFSIGRYDHYFDAVNNKANFWLAFDSFALGAMVVAYKDFVQPLYPLLPVPNVAFWLDTEMAVFIALSLISIALILSASFPFNRPAKKLQKKKKQVAAVPELSLSLLYYDHVAIRSIEAFSTDLKTVPLSQLAHDYHGQAHHLSQGLAGKYRRLRQAGWVLFAQLGVLALLFLTFFLS